MPYQTVNENAELIQLCEDIAIRHIQHDEGRAFIVSLGQFVKNRTVWRTNLASTTAVAGLWDRIRADVGGEFADLILVMTQEFIFRSCQGTTVPEIAHNAAMSLSWPAKDDGLNVEVRSFTSPPGDYKEQLTNSPWSLYLYLLSMSNIINRALSIKLEDPQ